MEDVLFENEIALVLIVKNESRYISEWLEYHYRIGVDKFYIYNNESEDRSELLEILDPWIRAGIVEFEDAFGQFRQMPVYNSAIENYRFNCRWMGFIDTDEFIYIKTGQNLPEFLHEYFDGRDIISGFCINWRMFGTSGRESYEPLDVIDRFTFREEDRSPANLLVKTIVNPRRILYMPTPHNAQYMIYSEGCDEALRYVREANNPYNTCDKIQLNHYFTKSREEYILKHARGRADCGMKRESLEGFDFEHRYNSTEDVGLKNLWRRLKTQPLPPPKDRSSRKILENVRTMLAPFSNPNLTAEFFEGQTVKLLTCFFAISRCEISTHDKSMLRNFVLELLTKSIEARVSITDLTILLVNIPQILSTQLPARREFLLQFKKYLPQLILAYQIELETAAEFHARHISSILDLI